MAHTINNNFKALKGDFKTDTGKNADDNLELYIHYFNARMSDRVMQYNHILVNELANGLNYLPTNIQMKIGELVHSLKKSGTL